MLRNVLFILLTAVAVSASAFVPQLSDEARVSFLTCGQGGVVYEKFGHTGIRFADRKTNTDVVFHWGIFSYDMPNFALRFMLGKTNYEMGPFRTGVFLSEYERRGSSVMEQDIDLNPEQINRLWRDLWGDFTSDRREYRYNFVTNNCATKAYDEMAYAYGAGFVCDYTLPSPTTYRDIINRYVDGNSWYNLGINIIIGSEADTVIAPMAAITFPEYTMAALSACRYQDGDTERSVVSGERMIVAQRKDFSTGRVHYWMQVLLPLLMIGAEVLYYAWRRRYMPVLTQVVCAVYGVIGLLILFLWFVSIHPLVDDNYNILWFSPLLLLLAVVMCLRGNARLKYRVAAVATVSVASYAVAAAIGLQGTTLPLMLWWTLILCATVMATVTYRNESKRYDTEK